MAARVPRAAPTPKGNAKPRIAPPTPARSTWKDLHTQADEIGITFMPWQDTTGRYLEALGLNDRHLYPEIAVIVGRQNGKTEILKPLITRRLRQGRRIMHTAQNRELPREIHDAVATIFLEHYADELLPKRGIRFGAGQEEIRLRNGGHYRIVAPSRGGARGPANDDVIIDELREMESHDFIAAAEPTLSASPDPQIIYLSNAGTEDSEVLNAIKRRAGADPALAYLEWSAAPECAPDDLAGWLGANPAVGHLEGKLEYLRRKYESYRLAGTLGIWETEHLCRWQTTTQPAFVAAELWDNAHAEPVRRVRPTMGVALDPSGLRASAVLAWPVDGGTRAEVVADVTGEPIDLERLGPDLRLLSRQMAAVKVVGDPYSEPLLRYFPSPVRMTGREYATASTEFVRSLEGGKLTWQGEEDPIGADLPWATRQAVGPNALMAVPTKADHPITALLAAIRAVWLASAPRPSAGRIR